MKKHRYLKLFLFISIIYLLSVTNTYAFSQDNYSNKSLCGKFELDEFKSNGAINAVGCFNTYEEAKKKMKESNSEELGILTGVQGRNKMIDANYALLDLSVNPETLTLFYKNSNLTSQHTYMDTGSLYGGVDGIHLDSTYSQNVGKWVAKVRIASLDAWIPSEAYEIVPLSWVKSSSSYTVTNESIRHNYVAKIQNTYTGSSGSTIGPKPNMLQTGTYYSYDGHYFYNRIKDMIIDAKNNTNVNAVNKTPYYNYYMYLSNHTKTTYSSTNIDEYIRNNLGYNKDVYGNAASANTSRLYGQGIFFYNSQEKNGVNALLSLSLSRNETGNGRSNLAINKNNGFGLNAVDSNPIEAANWYVSYQTSIMGYTSKWITEGYAKATDWRYFGPQFGEKYSGMNVKYAADTYWSEKMAANYYQIDKAYGLQDYNFYQEAVTKGPTNAYYNPNTSSKLIYTYPEAEDALVIIGETTGENINGSNIWYKVISDMNIDKNGNKITGDYNWDNNYVYVPKSQITLINTPKNKYNTIDDITEYQDKNYTYDLFTNNNTVNYKVAKSIKNTNYYLDSTLNKLQGTTLLKDRYVMVYTAAYNEYGEAVSYLVTSDYMYNQKHWVSADSIQFVTCGYAKAKVTVSGNQYTWVNYNRVDAKYSLISGLYTHTFVPVLEVAHENNEDWYKVPVSLTTNDNIYGYTLTKAPGVGYDLYNYISTDNVPIITAKDLEIIEGQDIDVLKDVTANDIEDGNITSKIKVIENNIDNKTPGTYKVTYQVTDSKNNTTSKTITVKVIKNEVPVITAEDIDIKQNEEFDPKKDVKAFDKEDGDLTNIISIKENTVNNKEPGEYKVTYQVTDSYNQTTTKTIKVKVIEVENNKPVIEVSDKEILLNSKYDPLENVTAKDIEDGNITNKIEVVTNNVNTKVEGTYKVTYQVTDSDGNKIEKTINVKVIKETIIEGKPEFYLNSLEWNSINKTYNISGYLIVLDKDNSREAKYELVLSDKNSDKEYIINVSSWTKNVPYDLGEDNGNSYSNSWFKDNIDLKNIPNGDYDLYMRTTKGNIKTESVVSNVFNKDIDRRAETSNQGYSLKVLLNTKTKKIELNVRDNLITKSTSTTFRNMFNNYEDISFTGNYLKLVGTSYNYDGTYNSNSSITRNLVLEDQTTFKRYTYNIGSTNNGPYKVTSTDNKSKEYAWFDKEVDVTTLPKGKYTMYIYTKTIDSEDYGELSDIFGMINDAKTTINNKKYTVVLNKNKNNRIELVVE